MLARALHVEVQAFMTRRWLLASLEVGALDHDPAIGHLSHTHQEVLRLHLAAHHLRIVVDLDLFGEDAALLVFFLNELVSHLNGIHESFVLADNFRFVLLESHKNCLMSDLVYFYTRQALLDCFFGSLVGCLHDNFLRSWVCLQSFNQLVLLLLQLVFKPFLLHL